MGANSSDDHEQQQKQLVVVGSADNDIIDHHHHRQQQQHVEINSSMLIKYKCSFCDRGFSNAQALGGHMNVHRRDRAAKFINNNNSSSTSSDHQTQLLPWINSTKLDQEYQEADDDHEDIHVTHNKPLQLPLFVDTVLPSRLISCNQGHEEHGHEVIDTKRQLMMHQPSTSSHGHDLANYDDRKLDLELRLGLHDPDDSTGTMSTTSTTTGTRDFF